MTVESVQSVREKTIETLKTYFVEDAQELIQKITELEKDPEIASDSSKIEELRVYKHLMQFIAFATLPEADQLELFRSSLLKAFRVGVDLKNRFAIKMNLTPDVLWPETAQAFVENILKNTERLGEQNILVRGEKEPAQPMLCNWLRDYNRIYGMDRHEKIIPHRYLTENPNAQLLNREDQVLLLKALEFYEGIKFPTQAQIQAALEKALDQVAETDPSIFEENEPTEGERTIENVRENLALNSEDNLDNDIETLIRKFPKVTDQPISGKPIKLLFNDQLVQPTVSNWLADYRAYVGVGEHEVNERSDYLLRSPNVQNLSPEERERLGLLLRSYDEHYLLPFSVSRQEILFNRVKARI
jgi:hypothetical protein